MSTILYLILAVIGLFAAMQVYIRISTLFKKGKKLEGLKGKLGQDVGSGRKLLVYFYSNNCAACRPMTPIIDRLKQEYNRVHKINVPNEMVTARVFGIMATPTTVIVDNGRISHFLIGVKNFEALQKLII
jgi:thioredoxin 1